jgi:hypothetical protein
MSVQGLLWLLSLLCSALPLLALDRDGCPSLLETLIHPFARHSGPGILRVVPCALSLSSARRGKEQVTGSPADRLGRIVDS